MPITPDGFTPNTPQQELEAVQDVFTSVLGLDVDLDPAGVVGQLIQQLTNMGLQVESALSILYGLIYDPRYSYGVFLDAICAWNNIERRAAEPSTVSCLITGLSGVVIPINSQILNTNGDVFYNETSITIPGGGSITASFRSLATGEIPCAANTVNNIVQQLAGWDTVNNPTDGTLGQPEQTDNSLRYTRRNSLAVNSTSMMDALNAAIEQESTITNWYTYENTTENDQTVNGIVVKARGILVVAYGGTDQVVAGIIYRKKSGGCVMTGNTTVVYTNPNYTWASSPIIFERPTATPIEVNIQIANDPNYPADIVTQIQNAVVANFYGTNNVNTFVQIGVTMYASRFVPTLFLLGVAEVYSCLTCVVSGTPAETLLLPLDQVPTLVTANVNVVMV